MGCLQVGFQRIGGCEIGHVPISGIATTAERQCGLKVEVFFVCRVGKREFIRVTPEQPLWIDVNMDGTYTVRSNTNWILQ